MQTRVKLSLAAAALAAAIPMSFAAAAHAEVSLSVADLDFHKPADLAAFNERLQAAAHTFCAGQSTTGTRVANQGPCIRAVVQEAYENLDAAHKRDIVLAGDKIVLKGLASR